MAASVQFAGPDSPDERKPIVVRHPDVAHEHIRSERVEDGQSLTHRSQGHHLGASKLKDSREHRASIVIVIDENDAETVEPCGPVCCHYRIPDNASFGVTDFVSREYRQPHNESGPQPMAWAFRVNGPVVLVDESLHNGKPKTDPTLPPRGGGVCLTEALEEARKKARVDALPGIGNSNLGVRAIRSQHNLNAPARGCELDRVR